MRPERPASSTRVEQLVQQMTWAEKLGQLQIVFKPNVEELHEAIRAGLGSVFWPRDAGRANELQRIALEESRLGIPLLVGLDVIHGQYTMSPTPIAQASSFDAASVEEAAGLAAREASAGGVNWTFSPMIDVCRDPRWGRVVEGFGEDPIVNSVMGAAMVRGYQGDDLSEPSAIAATAKHYVGYGRPEGGRDYNTADMSEHEMHNVYLPPFKAAIDAGAASVMVAFNTIGGRPMHAHRRLLTTQLKDSWGFEGVVVGDADGVVNLVAHGVAEDIPDAAAQAMAAGLDVEMGGNLTTSSGDPLLGEGHVSADRIDDAVRRVLELKERLGLFERPYVDQAQDTSGSDERARAQVRTFAARSTVLLKNDGTLPIEPRGRILLAGPYSESTDHLGAWTQSFATQAGTIADEFRARFPHVDVVVDPGCDFLGDGQGIEAAAASARGCDLVVAFVGEPSSLSGEATSRSNIKLPGAQETLVHALADTGVPLVVVLENGRPLDLSGWIERAPAVIEAWHLGTEAPAAIVDVLVGDAEPAGRLPISFPRSVGQVPIYAAHEPTGRPASTGGSMPGSAVDVALIGPGDVAGRFTSKYLDAELGPLFPFGHGSGYACFSYSEPEVSQVEPDVGGGGPLGLSVSLDVTNVSARDGDDTIFVFLHDPVSKVSQPVRRLLAFSRRCIAAGATERFVFTLTGHELCYWDTADGFPVRTLEEGQLVLYVGSTLADAQPVSTTVTFTSPV